MAVPRMCAVCYRFLCLAELAFWMGGFTFYAAVVVPIGSRVLGSVEQGLVTQEVTYWLNGSGVAALVLLFPALWKNRWLVASWLTMALTQGVLFGLHPRLDAMIDPAERMVTDSAAFYRLHEAYLTAATVQWLAALVALWAFAASDRAREWPAAMGDEDSARQSSS